MSYLNLESAIDKEIANEIEDPYTHNILEDKNTILFNICPCEADEMWSFVDNKGNKQWIWLAMNVSNRQIIGLHIGDRSEDSARALWDSINPYFRTNCVFFTDFYKPYQNVIPDENHVAINKSYKSRFTNHIERFNNTIRQRCSRLVRLALSFSKKLDNHIGAIRYFIADYNKERALHV
jgi:IS1 family transposase